MRVEATWIVLRCGILLIKTSSATWLQGTENCYVYGSKNNDGLVRLIATLRIENLVIVDTLGNLLVANKDKVQNIKKIVAQIKASGCT